MENANRTEWDDEDMYASVMSWFERYGAMDVLNSHSMSTLELALLSYACEYPHTLNKLVLDFSQYPRSFGYIDYPQYVPVEDVSAATVEHAVARLLDRSMIRVADEQFVDSVRAHLAEGGLFSSLVRLPESQNVVPLPLGIAIYKQVGERLEWVWEEYCRVSRWCGMTCTSSLDIDPLFLRFGRGNTFPHSVCRQMRLIGNWYSDWWNEHQKGYAVLCRISNPDEIPQRDIIDSTTPEVQMWRRDILFDDNWRPGMSPTW